MKVLRSDIQALRGWAVLLVLLDHVKIGPFTQGYLGVDIFFVISGFLITGLIARAVQRGTFSFTDFYFRRMKRLLPAAYVTIFLTIIFARWSLTSLELQDFVEQVYGSLTWTINFVLWSQTDYFAGSASLKPLLHMWSLAVEEQFYLVVPLLLFFVPERFWRRMVALIVITSFCLCLYLTKIDQSAAFYLLPSRAWELALGAVGALFTFDGKLQQRFIKLLFWPSIAVLALLPVWTTGFEHPGLDAAIICIATIIVILRRHELLGSIMPRTGLVKLGDISYSLYLIHWPIIAFMNNAFIGEPALEYRVGTLVLSVVLATILYTVVENPIHRTNIRPSLRNVTILLATTILLGLTQHGVATSASAKLMNMRRANWGFGPVCDNGNSLENPKCKNSNSPEVFVWGDSYAMHLIKGIEAVTKKGVRQATMSSCAPILDIAFYKKYRPNPDKFSRSCIEVNDKTLKAIAKANSVTTVILSSPFRGQGADNVLIRENGNFRTAKSSKQLTVEKLRGTILAIQALGKRVILVSPPPIANGDTARCVERKQEGMILLGDNLNCEVQKKGSEEKNVLAFLEEIKATPGLTYVSLRDALCDETKCQSEVNGVSIYRDRGHLSYAGSVEAIRLTHLAEILR
jgi:peptidoglycan/LPS O-acetylase OafA/YrhL